MNIGEVSYVTGLSAKSIRYYERLGLIRPNRAPNGYRVYRWSDIEILAFLGQARRAGFTVENCKKLLELQDNPRRRSADVKRLAQQRMRTLKTELREKQAMCDTLSGLLEKCSGDHCPDCAILRYLSITEVKK